jgi:hypothetical protein
MGRRISDRRYPAKNCKNPACKRIYEPHDRRQEYCTSQCRINAGNDKRYQANQTRFSDEKQTRLNNKILESLWNRLSNEKPKHVYKSFLEWERFKFDTQSLIRKNDKSGQTILWYYDYGLELVDEKQNLFEIHKKS